MSRSSIFSTYIMSTRHKSGEKNWTMDVLEPIRPITHNWAPHYSRLFKYTTTHCRFFRQQKWLYIYFMGPALKGSCPGQDCTVINNSPVLKPAMCKCLTALTPADVLFSIYYLTWTDIVGTCPVGFRKLLVHKIPCRIRLIF